MPPRRDLGPGDSQTTPEGEIALYGLPSGRVTEPDRALRGLEAEALAGRWPEKAWGPFFWERRTLRLHDVGARIARLLLDCPKEEFGGIAGQACHWLTENYAPIDDDDQWKLWDKILAATSNEPDEADDGGDLLTQALGAPAGRLTEFLLHKLREQKGKKDLSRDLRKRMDRLVAMPELFGKLARVRFAAEVSLLFDLAPDWTTQRLLPLFELSSPEASAMWSARNFSNYIGAPQLIGLTKASFLGLLHRADTPPEQLRVHTEHPARYPCRRAHIECLFPVTGALIGVAATRLDSALKSLTDCICPRWGGRWSTTFVAPQNI